MADQGEDSREIKLDLDQFRNADEIPAPVCELIDQLPFIIGGEGEEELQLIHEGVCVICRTPLGEATTLTLDDAGITSIVCSGVCHTDGIVAAHLHELMGDLMDRVQHRRELKEGHGG